MFAIGGVFSSLGSDVVKQADSLRDLGHQVTVFFLLFFFAVTMNGGRVRSFVCGGEIQPTQRG